MMKRILVQDLVVLTVLASLAPVTAVAVSYPILEEHQRISDKAVMNVGATVYLFHSGTPESRNNVIAGDTLVVYREGPACELKEVGRIKIRSLAGANYIKGEVIAGSIKHDDLARKGAVSYLVVLSDEKCK